MARPGKKKRVLFILEIVVLLLFIGGLYVYGQITSRLDKVSQPKIEKEKILVNSGGSRNDGIHDLCCFRCRQPWRGKLSLQITAIL